MKQDTPWTSRRCNRLLRPLLSKLSILEKSTRSRGKHDSVSQQEDDTAVEEVRVRRPTTQKDSSESEYVMDRDPDWLPMHESPNRLKRKYCSRSYDDKEASRVRIKRRKAACMAAGEIYVPTPLISRRPERGGSLEAENKPRQPRNNDSQIAADKTETGNRVWKKKNSPLRSHISSLKDAVGVTNKELIEGLYESFEKLLLATSTADEAFHSATGTLMSSCLRLVPTYIAQEEERLLDESDDEEVDVSQEVYTELESFEPCAGSGWPHLRVVVRAHGVHAICNAVSTGLIDAFVVKGFVLICTKHNALVEAEKIISHLLMRLEPLPQPTGVRDQLFDTEEVTILRLLKSYAIKTSRDRFLYEEICKLLHSGKLAVQWLACHEMDWIWINAIGSISRAGPAYNACTKFIETIFSRTLGPEPMTLSHQRGLSSSGFNQGYDTSAKIQRASLGEALNNTISSLLTVLTSIVLVSNEMHSGSGDDSHDVIRLIDTLSANLLPSLRLYDSSVQERSRGTLSNYFTRTSVFLTNLLILESVRATSQARSRPFKAADILEHIELLESRTGLKVSDRLETYTSLICSISTHCGRAHGNGGFTALRHIVDHLVLVDNSSPARYASWLMKNLGVSSALSFAETSGSAEHAQYARGLEQKLKDLGAINARRAGPCVLNSTPIRPKGFRWEDGICEWVSATPATITQQTVAVILPCSRQGAKQKSAKHTDHDEPQSRAVAAVRSRTLSRVEIKMLIGRQRDPPRPQKTTSLRRLLSSRDRVNYNENLTPERRRRISCKPREKGTLLPQIVVKSVRRVLGRGDCNAGAVRIIPDSEDEKDELSVKLSSDDDVSVKKPGYLLHRIVHRRRSAVAKGRESTIGDDDSEDELLLTMSR